MEEAGKTTARFAAKPWCRRPMYNQALPPPYVDGEVCAMSTGSFRWFLPAFLGALFPFVSAAQETQVHHVSRYWPVQGPRHEMAVDRPRVSSEPGASSKTSPASSASSSTNPWQLQASIPGAVIHDLSFPTATVGFAAAELGQVWKTTDGGATWTEVMNLDFPYFWYGVYAFNTNDVIVSGFNDVTFNGLARWSHDGGATWSDDIILSANQWSARVRFVSPTQGLIMDSISDRALVHYTTNGGATAADWTSTNAPAITWFGNEFSLLPSLHTQAAGVYYCSSPDAGANWSCKNSVDPIFDGGVFFADDNHGWVGGGEIYPGVEGWVHRTTDGGQTWSGRVLDNPWPIREILFVSPTVGWAAGGNIYTNVGGIYFSSDGGQTWSLDMDSNGREMVACQTLLVGDGYRVWCGGYNSSFDGAIYTVQGASTPAFSPAPQSFNAPLQVSLSASTPGATIYYTTDGSAPLTSSTVYTAPIDVESTATVQAIAVAPGYAPSMTATGLYTLPPPPPPPPDLELTAPASPVTVKAGSSANVQLTIGASASTSNVTFSCLGLPSGVQCAFSPSQVDAGTSPTNVALTISASTSAAAKTRPNLGWTFAAILPGVFLLGSGSSRRRRTRLLAGLFMVGVLSLTLTACGGAGDSHSTQTDSTQTVQQPVQATITVTASATGATSSSAQIQLTITP